MIKMRVRTVPRRSTFIASSHRLDFPSRLRSESTLLNLRCWNTSRYLDRYWRTPASCTYYEHVFAIRRPTYSTRASGDEAGERGLQTGRDLASTRNRWAPNRSAQQRHDSSSAVVHRKSGTAHDTSGHHDHPPTSRPTTQPPWKLTDPAQAHSTMVSGPRRRRPSLSGSRLGKRWSWLGSLRAGDGLRFACSCRTTNASRCDYGIE